MICVSFIRSGDEIAGFDVSGHAGYAEHGEDIICAAVSSACYMTANTITEIIGAKANVTEDDGHMLLTVNPKSLGKTQDILRGFELHMKQMCEDYPKHVRIK